MRIQVIRHEGYYNVITDQGMAWRCGFDEALGVVASWLLNQKLPYIGSVYSRYYDPEDVVIAGLLPDLRVTGSTSMATYVPRPQIRETVREKQYPYL